MTNPKPLSPAAQAVLDAFWKQPGDRSALAASLRAAAPMMQFVQDHEKLLAIATELEGTMADQFPDATKMVPSLADRIALAICVSINAPPGALLARAQSANVAGHQPAPPAGWQPIDPDKEAMALAIGRELRRHDV